MGLIPGMLAPLIQSTLLLFCGYLSFKAIESGSTSDDTHWLTFWFVFAVFSFAKSVLDYISFAIPFYHEASTGFIVYLGFFGGAKTLYESVLKPLLKQHEAEIDAKLAKAQGMANETLKKAQDATKTQ